MIKRLKILLIVDPERKDFYNYLSAAINADFYILWHVKRNNLTSIDLPSFIKGQYFWGEYITPFSLLKKISPDKVVFFEIIDLRQIALIVAAKAKKISTFYLEHGAAGSKETAISRWDEIDFRDHKIPYLKRRLLYSFGDVLKSKLFYYSAKRGFNSLNSYLKYLILPFKMLKGSPNEVLTHTKFKERVPDTSIVFNKANYEEYALYTGIQEDEAIFTGVPSFDNYYLSSNNIKDYIVFIDHPYMEEKICGWTSDHHSTVAKELFKFAEQKKKHIYIKLHPRSDASVWQNYNYNREFVTIIQHGDFIKLFLEAKLILGFSSSLITGFLCAKKNVVLLGWHPEPKIFGADFSNLKLCHKSLDIDELQKKYDYWVSHNMTEENEIHYQNFLKEFNYPFDGKATQRVVNAIIENEAS